MRFEEDIPNKHVDRDIYHVFFEKGSHGSSLLILQGTRGMHVLRVIKRANRNKATLTLHVPDDNAPLYRSDVNSPSPSCSIDPFRKVKNIFLLKAQQCKHLISIAFRIYINWGISIVRIIFSSQAEELIVQHGLR
jgi:hypothetical protein